MPGEEAAGSLSARDLNQGAEQTTPHGVSPMRDSSGAENEEEIQQMVIQSTSQLQSLKSVRKQILNAGCILVLRTPPSPSKQTLHNLQIAHHILQSSFVHTHLPSRGVHTDSSAKSQNTVKNHKSSRRLDLRRVADQRLKAFLFKSIMSPHTYSASSPATTGRR